MEFSNQFLKLNGSILTGKRLKLFHIKLYLREQKQYCCVYGQMGQKSCLWAKENFILTAAPKQPKVLNFYIYGTLKKVSL